MTEPAAAVPLTNISVDAEAGVSELQTWRHGLRQGGINPHPLPDSVAMVCLGAGEPDKGSPQH